MGASRAMAMLKLWRVAHEGRPVQMERDEEETSDSSAVGSKGAPEIEPHRAGRGRSELMSEAGP